MKRTFDIGDKVVCAETGVRGIVKEFYYPTTCPEQTMIRTEDGRLYHAPTSTWVRENLHLRKDCNE